MNPALEKIEKLLHERIGLDVNAVARRGLRQVLRGRILALGTGDEIGYLARLEADPDEVANLINAVVVPETWFFRDVEPFAYLKKYVTHVWLPRHPGRRLRLLSIPCATGEEPFSMAMALMDVCLEPGFFTVDAVDVSRVSLDKARAGLFNRHSFRGDQAVLQDRYFKPEGKGFRILDEIRSSVRFIEAHALEFAAAAPAGSYDIVFCRNLLIYLAETVRPKLLRELDRLLAADGLFFLGHAEAPCVFLPDYEPVSHPGSFAARKRKKPGFPPPPIPPPAQAARKAAGPPAAARPVPPAGAKAVRSEPAIDRDLEAARMAADRGDYDRAGAICEKVLAKRPGSAEAYHVSGLVALARGREEEAVRCFEKTLYLDPAHRQALVHLGLLMDKAGRPEQARRYRRVSERLDNASIKVGA